MTADDHQAIRSEFHRVVNMSPAKMRGWLASDESRSVGMTSGGEKVAGPEQPEAVGHHMGERILQVKALRQADLTEDDYHDMRKVVGYVHRHLAQCPKGDVSNTRWRKSLMNWGHDPLLDVPARD